MVRRQGTPLGGAQYCGDQRNKIVHDLNCEQPECRIEDLLHSGQVEPFETWAHAWACRYTSCKWCIGGLGGALTEERRSNF